MSFLTLLEVASMPIIQILIISILGALMATDYLNLLPAATRKTLNKIVFMVFTPSLVFTSLDQGVTLQDIISWWYMPVNIGLTFLFGGILGWIVVKLVKPEPHLEGLITAMCSTGNLGNLIIIIVPAICTEEGSPFGDHKICSRNGLSYSSFSMARSKKYIKLNSGDRVTASGKVKTESGAKIKANKTGIYKRWKERSHSTISSRGSSRDVSAEEPTNVAGARGRMDSRRFKGGKQRQSIPNAHVRSELKNNQQVRKERQKKATKLQQIKSNPKRGKKFGKGGKNGKRGKSR